jgi:hypothetical protein
MYDNQINKKKSSNPFLIIIVVIGLLLFLNRGNIASYMSFNNKKDGLEYDGEIRYTNKVNKNDVTFQIIAGYSDIGDSNNYFIRKIDSNSGRIGVETCELKIDYVANYKNAEHLAQGIANKFNISYAKDNIGGRECYHLSYSNRMFNNIIYLFDYNNKLLIVEGKASNDECNNQLEQMARTIHLN